MVLSLKLKSLFIPRPLQYEKKEGGSRLLPSKVPSARVIIHLSEPVFNVWLLMQEIEENIILNHTEKVSYSLIIMTEI